MIKHNTHPCQQNNENKDQKWKLYELFIVLVWMPEQKHTTMCAMVISALIYMQKQACKQA